MRRHMIVWGLAFLFFALIGAKPTLAGDISINFNVDLNLGSTVQDCPLPTRTVIIAPENRRYGSGWTEYQSEAAPDQLIIIYRSQMPKRGWTLVRVSGNTYYWAKGDRQLQMVFISTGPSRSVIALSETKVKSSPPGKAKGWKKKHK